MDSRNEAESTPKKSKKQKQKSLKIQPSPEDDTSNDTVISQEISSTPTNFTKNNKISIAKQIVTPNSLNKKRRKRDSATSSDEERWLTAIESGKLEDVDDELKKIKPKDPSLMTARQRAMYDRTTDNNQNPTTQALMSLPTGYKEKVMTAEAIQKAAIKSQKRKQLADEKREKDKKKTMERLLKKQDSKINKIIKSKPTKSTVPSIIYRQTVERTTLTFPDNIEFPLKARTIRTPTLKYCSMSCGNLRKYTCSQTGSALCSLECYKKNIADRIL